MKTTQELSWLQFNRRVLEQTRRCDFPVAERVRFLGIWASNLDEFYAARIGHPSSRSGDSSPSNKPAWPAFRDGGR